MSTSDFSDEDWMDVAFMDECGLEADPSITLEQVQKALSRIRGSMDAAVNEDRGEY